MLTDRESHFGGALSIAALNNTSKNFTEDINWLVASDAVDAQGHLLNPDKGQSDIEIWIFTQDGITGNGAVLNVEMLIDDDSAFGSAEVRTLWTGIAPGASGIAAGTEFARVKIPKPTKEQHWRLRIDNTVATAVGAGATISARVIE